MFHQKSTTKYLWHSEFIHPEFIQKAQHFMCGHFSLGMTNDMTNLLS